MIRFARVCQHSLLVVLIFASALSKAQMLGGPPPEIRGHIDALVAALNSGSAESWEEMAQKHFTPDQLKSQSAVERKQLFENIRRDFGTISLGMVEGPDQPLRLHIHGSTGASGLIELTLEDNPPFKIQKIGIRMGGSDGENGAIHIEPPAVNGSMSNDQLATVLNGYLKDLAAKDIFSGNVLIAKDGQAVYTGSTGFADRADSRPNNASTRFNIGSVNKLFTKAAIEQLVVRGKLSLSDTIGTILPDYPQAASRTATVDQLLHHTAGIADVFGDDFDREPKDRFRSNADYYKLVRGIPPSFSPGERTQYCNGCFVVLGAIIARVTDMPYEKYMEENIFRPAGMKSTGYLESDGINRNVALGYTRHSLQDPFQSNILMNGASGCAAGGGYSTVDDLYRFSQALGHGAIPNVAPSNNLNVGGGAPGINAIVQQQGPWTVVVLANLDPPAAELIGTNLQRALSH